MTSLLTYTVAHSTRPSYRLKINHQPLKKILSLAVNFYSTERKTQKLFKWLVVGFGPKGIPCGMCDIVR